MRKSLSNTTGVSTIEIAIGVVLVMGIISAGIRYLIQSGKISGHLHQRAEIFDLQSAIRSRLSCDSTISAFGTSCDGKSFSDNVYISLKANGGSPLAVQYIPPSTYTTIGRYGIRAKCANTNGYYELQIESRREAAGYPTVDPLTRRVSDWKDIFYSIPLVCKSTPASPSPLVYGQTFFVKFSYPSGGSTRYAHQCIRFSANQAFNTTTGLFESVGAVGVSRYYYGYYPHYSVIATTCSVPPNRAGAAGMASGYSVGVSMVNVGCGAGVTGTTDAFICSTSLSSGVCTSTKWSAKDFAKVYLNGCYPGSPYKDLNLNPTEFPGAQLIYSAP